MRSSDAPLYFFSSAFRQTQAYKFLFLITDGISNTEVEKEPQLIEELHSRNISVYGVGVGLFLKYKLQNITRNASRVILVKQYDELSGIVEVSNMLFFVFGFIYLPIRHKNNQVDQGYKVFGVIYQIG